MRGWMLCMLAGLLVSCHHDDTKNILPRDKMQSVLWDMLLADETLNYYLPKDSSFSRIDKRMDYYQTVLKLHQLTKEEFRNSYLYYQAHPEQFKPILDSLQAMGDRASAQQIPVKADSIGKKPLHPLPDSNHRSPLDSARRGPVDSVHRNLQDTARRSPMRPFRGIKHGPLHKIVRH